MKYCYLICLLMVFGASRGQDTPANDFDPFYTNENLPASPEAGELGVYGDISNNLYNGKANISIPIHAIKFDGLNIPISLSYDSGGIKIAQEASWVGLNWNLSTNFGISRAVRGQDDLNDNNALNAPGEGIGYVFNGISVQQPIGSGPFINAADIEEINNSFFPQQVMANVDMQPDIMTLNAFGNTYKFRFKKQVGASQIINTFIFNNNSAEITYNLNNDQFQLLDENGFTFLFGTKEYSTNFSSQPNPTQSNTSTSDAAVARQNIQNDTNGSQETIISNWRLDKIISPYGNELNFQYTRGIEFTFPTIHASTNFDDMSAFANGVGGHTGADFNASSTVLEKVYLTSIYGDFGSVDFQLGSRLDILNGQELYALCNFTNGAPYSTANGTIPCCSGASFQDHSLDKILVKDYNNNIIQEVDLTYSYYNKHKITSSDKERYLRLKLDQVDIGDKKYTMSYINPDELPAKDSFDVDFWGYANGATNSHNIPSIGRFYTTLLVGLGTPGQNFVNYSGANRGSNFEFGKIGLLGRITYPTGGYTEITYEGNRASVEATQPYTVTETTNGTDIRWTSLVDESRYNFQYEYLKLANDSNYSLYGNEFQGGDLGDPIKFTKGVPIELDLGGLLIADGELTTHTGESGINYYYNRQARVVEDFYNPDSNSTIYIYGDFPDQDGMTWNKESSVVLPAGDYVIAERSVSGEIPPPNISTPAIQVHHETDSIQTPYTIYPMESSGIDLYEEFEVGGARVSILSNYDANGDFISRRSYDYTLVNNSSNSVSSGMLVDDLIFFSKKYGQNSYNPRPWGMSTLKFQSNPALPFTNSAQGSHIGYSQVRELTLDINNLVISELVNTYSNDPSRYYTESFCREYNSSSGQDPDVCVQNTYLLGLDAKSNFEFSNGRLLSSEIFDQSANLIKKESYEYVGLVGNIDEQYFASFTPIKWQVQDIPTDGTNYYLYRLPYDYSAKVEVSRKQTDIYEQNGVMTSVEHYYYDPSTHHLISKDVEIDEGDIIETAYYYPYSSEVSSLPYMGDLVNDRRLSTVVATKSSRNQNTLSERIYSYNNISGPIMVSKVSTSKGNQTNLVDNLLYERYDNKGRLLQARKRNGIPISYIWGYNNQFVVAKIENITYAEIENLSSFGQSFNISNALSAAQENQLRGLEDAFVTTYTYLPGIGLETITDQRGYTLKYMYDTNNRLKYVLDQDENVVSSNNYNLVNNWLPEDINVVINQENNALDADGDGWSDIVEEAFNTDKNNHCSFPFNLVNQDLTPTSSWISGDCDGDGVTNSQEMIDNTNPQLPCELIVANQNTSPSPFWNAIDCDNDGVSNGQEMINGTDPLENEGSGNCTPPCPIALNDYVNLERNLNPSTQLKRIHANIELSSVDASSSIPELNFVVAALNGSGNYEFRWRITGETYPASYSASNTWSYQYTCGSLFRNRVTAYCEVRDISTGEIYIARWDGSVNLTCN